MNRNFYLLLSTTSYISNTLDITHCCIDGDVEIGTLDPFQDKLDVWLMFWLHLYSHSCVIWNRKK